MLRAATKPEIVSNAEFFTESTSSKVDDTQVEHPRLLQIRSADKPLAPDNALKTWNIIRCVGCGIDVYARQDASSTHLVNFTKLLNGPSDIESVRLKRQYSTAFKIVLMNDVIDDEKEPKSDDLTATAIREELEKRSQEYMAQQERAMRNRIETYEKSQKEGLRSAQDRMEEQRLHMFRLLLRCESADASVVSRVVKRSSLTSPRVSPGKSTSGPSTIPLEPSPLKDADAFHHFMELDDATFLQGSDDDEDDGGDDVDSEDDEEDRDDDRSEEQGMQRSAFARVQDSDRLEFVQLGSSLPISIPNPNMARSFNDKKGTKTAVRGEMVAASMREMRTRSNTLRRVHLSNSSISDVVGAEIPHTSPGSPPRD